MDEEAQVDCPDCRCTIRRDGEDPNATIWNVSRYCDPCLKERVLANERVEVGGYEDWTGRYRHLFAFVCSKCDGTGMYLVSVRQDGTDCNRCMGTGWEYQDHEGVRQTERWWSTYQANRRPASERPNR